ncbi:unnamed protein product [Linum tenue]|uniref:Remorin C-terminal domain-containing protein n=1 Tax=Linum tenue TaxID=586396 RepID=A0AAV0HZV0_9ROSI|nr:unnamed protein product [Linum tenue]
MDYLIRQNKGRVSGKPKSAAEGEASSSRERRIPVQKTESFKEKKRVWFGRQFSRQTDRDSDSMAIDQAAAVAAAAFAIAVSKRPSFSEPRRKALEEAPPQPPLRRTKSERLGSVSIRDAEGTTDGNIDDYDEKPAAEVVGPVSSMKRTSTFADVPASSMKKAPSYSEKPVSSMKKAPSFTNKPVLSMERLPTATQLQLNVTDGKRKEKIPESQTEQPLTKPEISLAKPDGTLKPVIPPSKPSRRTGIGESTADAWERVQLEKLKEKYEQQDDQIVSWESEKKAKARRRLDKTESELERTRLKALERFRSDMDTVTQIAGGARAKTAEKQKIEELKVKQKADIIRSTGKVPRSTCFCF